MAENFWDKDTVVKSDEWWSQDQVAGGQESPEASKTKTAPTAEGDTERTVGESIKDVGAGLVGGLGSLVQLPGQVYGLATGDFSKTGLLGAGERLSEYGEEMKSEGLKAREAQRAKVVEEASKEGQFAAFKAALGETITDPGLLANFLAEQAPQIIPMILAGGGAGYVAKRGVMSAAAARGAAVEAAERLAQKKALQAGTTAAIQTGAVMQGADIGAGAYDEIVAGLIEQGATPEQAAEEAINKARLAGVAGYGLSILANRYLPGGKALEEILAGKKIAGSRIGTAGVTALKEIPGENIEEVGGKVAQNIAAREAGLDREILEGTGETAALATLGAVGIGGGAGALSARPQAAEPKPDEFDKELEQFRKELGPEGDVAVEAPTEELDAEIETGIDAAVEEEATKEAPVTKPPVEFPGGFTATERELGRQEVPKAFGIFEEGSKTPLTTVSTQEEADRKIESLSKIRQEEQERLNKEVEKISNGILADQRKLEVMEATGQTNTDQYVQAKAELDQKEQDAAEKLTQINDNIVSYGAPLVAVPVGKRTAIQSEVVVNRGDEVIGTFPSLQAAESAMREMEPDTFKQADTQARQQQVEEVLKPAFAKFNLGDVGLNIVEAIKTEDGQSADGSYARNLIQVAMDAENPLQIMRHESMHALKELGFFTPQQWRALTEQANKTWVKQYLQNEMAEIEVDGQTQQVTRLEAYKRMGLSKQAIIEEAIADAFGAYARGATPPPGLIASLYKKLQNFFANFGQALRGAGFESSEDIFQRIERGELKPKKAAPKKEAPKEEAKPAAKVKEAEEAPKAKEAEAPTKTVQKQEAPQKEEEKQAKPAAAKKEAKATKPAAKTTKAAKPAKSSPKERKQAEEYFEENGIMPYTSEGELDLPVKPPKYSIQKYNPDKHLKFDPTLGVPINKDGTVTVYYHTTKDKSLQIGQSKVIPSDGRNRVYLSNESGGDAILRNKGNFDQDFDGSTVLVYVTPDMLQLDAEYENGRRDFFIPLQEGDFFNKKMKMQSIQKGRNDAITGDFSYTDHEEKISRAVKAYKDATPAERRKLIAQARKTLKKEHNVGSLLSENGKLEKTRIGEYGLDYEGNSVASQGLGLAAAQKITDKVSTCPRSAICEGLCLGETSGGNFMFGGTASEDVADIKKSAFRAGPRMMQYLKTEAMIINPEAFATLLQAEIDSLKKWSASPTQIKIDPETKKRLNVEKEIYQPAVRLNVTSDFKPEMFRGIIEGNPDVRFYDYTKLGGESLAENHHLTYSSTGFGQIVNGEKVFFKTKAGQYDHNWATMRKRLNNGQNVAMAFSSKSALPKMLFDEETQTGYRIWDGDDYDARFLDPKQPDGKGMIIGLRNKAGNLSEKNATEKTDGFFVKYDPKTDGDTVVVPDQAQFKDGGRKTIPLKQEKFSLRAPTGEKFKQWFGSSTVVDKDGNPKVMYHGLAKDTTDFTRKTARGAPIFLTDDPKFADRFAADSFEAVARNPQEYLSKEQMDAGVKRAIAAIRKDYGKDPLGKEMIESLKTGNLKDATPEAKEYIQKEFIGMLPAGPHVMPLYVRAERPFDYENPSHIRRIKEELTDMDADTIRSIASGSWEDIEGSGIQEAIQMAGFDSFYVKEHGRKNLAVYEPNQVKSATGNSGDYSRTSNDVRYSLKNVAFPSAEEAKKAATKAGVPDAPEFKRFIAGNQWVDEDGKPMMFYHATASEFFEFTPAGPSEVIYLSATADDSVRFGKGAEDRQRQRVYRALNKDEKLDMFERVVNEEVEKGKITKSEGDEFIRQAKRKIPEYGKFGDLDTAVSKALMDLSPTRMAIMPLFARAETPFDFDNQDHVERVIRYVESRTDFETKVSDRVKKEAQAMGAPTSYPDHKIRGLKGLIRQGRGKAIESKEFQQALRALGFDGFVIREGNSDRKTYAVYKPEQVKSITGNLGEYGRETKDMRFSLKKGRYSPNTFEKLWDDSMYLQNDAENKTKGYLAYVNPMEFVRATASPETFERLLQEQEPIDFDRMKAYGQAPYLTVEDKNGNWKITGHEGRHRMLALYEAGFREIPVYIHLRAEDAKPIPVKALAAQYDDSMSSVLMVAEVEPLSYANKKRAMDKFTRMDSKVKYSLPSIPAAAQGRIEETTTVRQEVNFARRIIDAISLKSVGHFRAEALNRYNQLSVYDKKLAEKMGGAVLLADQSAESAALMSDLASGVAASAMGLDNRTGGIPVLRNGVTTIDSSVKGLIASLAPLAAYGDPAIYRRYQYWAMVKRGVRLNKEGKETGITAADVAFAKMLEQKHPEFVSVQKDLIAFNNGLVKYMVDTGVLSKGRAAEYTKYADYVPFYRQMDGETTVGPNLFQSISGVRPPKKLKGGDAPLADFLETMVRNTSAAIQAGAKNYAAQRAINVVQQVKAPGMGATRLNYVSTKPDVVNVLENGEVVSYQTPDELLLYAVKSLNLSDIPYLSFVSKPADWLRNLVTKDPGFMMANLLRDSLSAYVTSGQSMTPVVDTVISFGKALADKSPATRALLDAGVISGYDAGDIESSGRMLEEDLARKAGKRRDAVVLRPFKSLWEGLEKGTTASDAATRAVIYERVLAETGNEAEALFRALEVMNFHRKGGSSLVRILTAAVPFFNARLQGLDLFYRASSGNMNTSDAAAIKRKFWARGMTMIILSGVYYFAVADDEEYKKQEQETRDNNWLLPSLGMKIPIPFEVGVLFKTIPERLAALASGRDTAEDFGNSLFRSFFATFGFNPIPQTVKPLVEVYFDKNMFTMRPILSEGIKDVEPQFQVGPNTSTFIGGIAGALGISPIKADHVIKGYTGTMGMYAVDTIDMIINQFTDSPKATKRFEQMPVIKRFALDPEARGNVTEYYKLKDAVDGAVRTMNFLEKQGESQDYVDYLVANQGTLAFKDYIRDTEKTMKELREARSAIRISSMSGDEKRDALTEIGRAENAITSQIQEIKKAIASVK